MGCVAYVFGRETNPGKKLERCLLVLDLGLCQLWGVPCRSHLKRSNSFRSHLKQILGDLAWPAHCTDGIQESKWFAVLTKRSREVGHQL